MRHIFEIYINIILGYIICSKVYKKVFLSIFFVCKNWNTQGPPPTKRLPLFYLNHGGTQNKCYSNGISVHGHIIARILTHEREELGTQNLEIFNMKQMCLTRTKFCFGFNMLKFNMKQMCLTRTRFWVLGSALPQVGMPTIM